MNTCPKCGYVRKPSDSSPEYSCPQCGIVYAKYNPEIEIKRQIDLAHRTGNWSRVPLEHIPEKIRLQIKAQQEADEAKALLEQQQNSRKNLLITTTAEIPGREVAQIIDIVSAECVLGMNIVMDFFTGITDVVGGRSGAAQSALHKARIKVIDELRTEAFSVGADAIIGTRIEFNEISGGGKSMIFAVAIGTAVKLTPNESAQ